MANVIDTMGFKWENELKMYGRCKYDKSIIRIRKKKIYLSPHIEFSFEFCDIGFNEEKNLLAIKKSEKGKGRRFKRIKGCYSICAVSLINRYPLSKLYKITKQTKDFIIAKGIESEE